MYEMESLLNDALVLEDERVLLRVLQPTDFDNFLPFSLNEPDTWYYSLVQAKGEDGLRNYMKQAFDGKTQRKEFPFIVFDKKTNEYAGSTRFYEINFAYQTVHLGYTWYGKRFWGTGLNKHCKFLLLQFAFEQLQMERVQFGADAANTRSIAAMKSIGCTLEGILRSSMPTIYGGRRDSAVLSILKDEWYGSVKEMLKNKLTQSLNS